MLICNNTHANGVAKISRRSAPPQRLYVSDITTSTICRGIESQSLVSDVIVPALVISRSHLKQQTHPV